jgi:hypothetical protein
MFITSMGRPLRSLRITGLTNVHMFISTRMRRKGERALRLRTTLEHQIKMHLMAVSIILPYSILRIRPGWLIVSAVLDKVKVEYDYKHPTLVTVIIDAFNGPTTGIPPPHDTEEWRLPTYDPRNETKYLYKLHSFDIYLWTKEDAQLFMSTIRRVLPEHHISLSGEPPTHAAHAEAMSPIVQQLENVAVSEHSYQQSNKPESRPGSTAPVVPSFPGPPTSAPPATAAPAATFAPIAYNPAAPAAPETFAHREKTPPPEDGAPNPLAVAAAQEEGQQYGPGFQPQPLGRVPPGGITSPGASYFPGPPSAAGGQYAPGSAPAVSAPVQQASPYGGYAPGYPQQAQYAGLPTSSGFQQPLQSPGFQQSFQSPGLPAQQAYPGSVPPPPTAPPGGFSAFSYSQAPTPAGGAADYNIHQQLYRPTEGEAPVKIKPQGEQHTSKLGQNAVRLEKGVTGFLKKFEKKYA